ncbi:MAG: Asp-tRNA(Asn)/Glu-tRNA(Gln) amidotransferase subunit GatB [bacterium]|nr:Asp-tRNA(Asn)/Glu-tRNA(Gln) amidotransferase subunit GatB [bacterium]
MAYEAVIGLEVHVQLATKSKLFCGCRTEFANAPNSQVCPVCLGLPGVLPVMNQEALKLALTAATALQCDVLPLNRFARKNYFYPDLPKAYQISQYDEPLAKSGYIDILVNGQSRKIGITRVHIEEDAGKLIHAEEFVDPDKSFVDYNRCGTPLIEIVSEPDMRTPEEAYEYLVVLKQILEYTKISDCNMEEGSLRCDANVSVRPKGTTELGTKAEVKNMNSFRGVRDALTYEIKRQIDTLEEGGRIVQETRLFDSRTKRTDSMRGKEEAHDYRYFPEPDLPPLEIDPEWLTAIRQKMPELPQAKKLRFKQEYSLSDEEVTVLTQNRALADFFEKCTKSYPMAKIVGNWVKGEVLANLSANNQQIEDSRLTPAALVSLLKLIDEGKISGKIAKEVLTEIFATGKSPEKIVEEKGMVQISEEGALTGIIEEVLAANPQPVAEYRAGKTKALGFLVGQIMKASKGQANPGIVNQLLRNKLEV